MKEGNIKYFATLSVIYWKSNSISYLLF